MFISRILTLLHHRAPGIVTAVAAFLLLFTSAGICQDKNSLPPGWKEAISAYDAKDYEGAIAAFKKIAEDESRISAELCHNLANCEYRLGEAADGSTPAQVKESRLHYGPAAMWYRRALALDPGLVEAKQNLRRLDTKLSTLTVSRDGLRQFSDRFPRWLWRTACQAGVWAAVISIVWLVWATPRSGRRWPLVTVLSVALGVIIASGIALYAKAYDPAPFSRRLVSIESPEVLARVAPAEASGSVIRIPPGSELVPLSTEGLWTYCAIPVQDADKPLRGWIRTSSLQPQWPWNASIVD